MLYNLPKSKMNVRLGKKEVYGQIMAKYTKY